MAGALRGRLVDLSFGRNGRQRLTIEIDQDFRGQFDDLHESDVDIQIKKHRKMRSNDANAMLWQLCEKIAEATNTTKEDVYRENIRQVGVYTPLPIRADAVRHFSDIWSAHGLGWFVDVVDDSKIEGYKLCFAYHGSSTYDTKEMSRLIDSVIQDANALGIDTMTDQERSLIVDAWAPSK